MSELNCVHGHKTVRVSDAFWQLIVIMWNRDHPVVNLDRLQAFPGCDSLESERFANSTGREAADVLGNVWNCNCHTDSVVVRIVPQIRYGRHVFTIWINYTVNSPHNSQTIDGERDFILYIGNRDGAFLFYNLLFLFVDFLLSGCGNGGSFLLGRCPIVLLLF